MIMNCQKELFNLDPGAHYLNCAYMSPMLQSVEVEGIKGIGNKRNPFHTKPSHFFEASVELRNEFSRIIDCDDPSRIAIIPGTSYGIATVAANLELNEGEEIIVLEGQFPSNYYTWQRKTDEAGAKLVTIDAPRGSSRGREWNNRILNAINDKTRVVALPHVHWADGTRFDLAAIRARTREVGAMLVIDGTQSVGALPFSVKEIEPDALICSGYKWLMGPYSIGLAYYGEAFLEGIPLEENWISRRNSEDFAGLVNYESDYQPGALRYDVAERSNFILLPMMLEALRQINEWGVENIYSYCKELAQPVLEELRGYGYQVEEEEFMSYHLFGLRKEGFEPGLFSERLSEKNIYVSVRGDAVRVSVNVFNDREDLEAFKEVCIELADQ